MPTAAQRVDGRSWRPPCLSPSHCGTGRRANGHGRLHPAPQRATRCPRAGAAAAASHPIASGQRARGRRTRAPGRASARRRRATRQGRRTRHQHARHHHRLGERVAAQAVETCRSPRRLAHREQAAQWATRRGGRCGCRPSVVLGRPHRDPVARRVDAEEVAADVLHLAQLIGRYGGAEHPRCPATGARRRPT